MTEKLPDSRDVARAAISLAMTATREDETLQKQHLAAQGIRSAASDFGGGFVSSAMKIIERHCAESAGDGAGGGDCQAGRPHRRKEP